MHKITCVIQMLLCLYCVRSRLNHLKLSFKRLFSHNDICLPFTHACVLSFVYSSYSENRLYHLNNRMCGFRACSSDSIILFQFKILASSIFRMIYCDLLLFSKMRRISFSCHFLFLSHQTLPPINYC